MMTIEDTPTEVLPFFHEDDDAAQLSACRHQVSIGFADNQTALGFSRAGDLLILGEGSLHSYARDFYSDDMALLRSTDEQTIYGIALGKVIVTDKLETSPLPAEPIYLRLGEPCEIPGVQTTKPIGRAMLSYQPREMVQRYVRNKITGELVVSPFIILAKQIITAAQREAELAFTDQ